EPGLRSVFRGLDLYVAGQQAHFAALIHAEGDFAEVHVFKRAVQRDAIAADGGDTALLGLARVEVGRGEHDLVARLPLGGIEDLDGAAAGRGSGGQFGPAVAAVAVQVQGTAGDHDAAVT